MKWELISPNGSPEGLPISIVCPPLVPGESHLTHPIPFKYKQSGRYVITCTADPEGKRIDRSRTNQTFTKSFNTPRLPHL